MQSIFERLRRQIQDDGLFGDGLGRRLLRRCNGTRCEEQKRKPNPRWPVQRGTPELLLLFRPHT